MAFIVATYVYASSQGQRTHSARTKITFVVATYVYATSQVQRTHSARTKIHINSAPMEMLKLKMQKFFW